MSVVVGVIVIVFVIGVVHVVINNRSCCSYSHLLIVTVMFFVRWRGLFIILGWWVKATIMVLGQLPGIFQEALRIEFFTPDM